MSFVLEPTDSGVDLVVTGDWTDAAREALDAGLADGLVLNYAAGFVQQPIDFIKGLPIRRFNLLARSVDDLTPLYSLASTLEGLSVQAAPGTVIALEDLPKVRVVAASWPHIQGSVRFAPQIEELRTSSYTEADLEPLSSLTSLTSLTMKECRRLRSLDGLEAFPWMNHLAIVLAPALDDINALARAQPPALQTLAFDTCKRVPDIEPLRGLISLRTLDFSECGEIPTVAPLRDLVNIERLLMHSSTNVADGDLSPIAELPKLAWLQMKSRRPYSPSVTEIQDAITRRTGAPSH